MTFTNGQILMFKDVLEEGDEELRFIFIEDRGDAVLVEAIIDLPFPPQNSFPKSDMILAPDQSLKQYSKPPKI